MALHDRDGDYIFYVVEVLVPQIVLYVPDGLFDVVLNEVPWVVSRDVRYNDIEFNIFELPFSAVLFFMWVHVDWYQWF